MKLEKRSCTYIWRCAYMGCMFLSLFTFKCMAEPITWGPYKLECL